MSRRQGGEVCKAPVNCPGCGEELQASVHVTDVVLHQAGPLPRHVNIEFSMATVMHDCSGKEETDEREPGDS